MSHTIVHTEDFMPFVSSGSPVLLDFTAVHCPHCRQMESVFEEIAAICPVLPIGKVDVDEEPVLAEAWVVRSVPTTMLFANGELAWRWTGYHTAGEILEQVSRLTEPAAHPAEPATQFPPQPVPAVQRPARQPWKRQFRPAYAALSSLDSLPRELYHDALPSYPEEPYPGELYD